jgi:hypothetical protein
MKLAIAACSAALLLAVPAQSQQPQSVLLDELVVTAPTPGPAWWRVSDDDSQVYVMVVPDVTVAGHPWDRRTLEKRMKGANVFIQPHALAVADLRSAPGMAGMMVQAPRMLLMRKPKFQAKDPRPIEEEMPPALRSRFVALREKIGQPADRYAGLAAWQVQGALERDYRAHLKLTRSDDFMGGPLVRDFADLAKRDKVRTETAYKITIPAVKLKLETVDEPPAEVTWRCLDAAMTRMAQRAERERAVFVAWAAGDVRPLLNPPPRAEPDRSCPSPGRSAGYTENPEKGGPITRMEEAFVRDQAAAVERALARPGHSVAVLEALSPLGRAEMGMLGKKGVLARLRSKGFEVVGPDGID